MQVNIGFYHLPPHSNMSSLPALDHPSSQPHGNKEAERTRMRRRRGGGWRLKIATASSEHHHTSQRQSCTLSDPGNCHKKHTHTEHVFHTPLGVRHDYPELVNTEICSQFAH